MKKLIQTLVFSLSMLFAGIAIAGPVDINTASATELATNINGVGEKKAVAIVEYRNQHGPFKKVEDLQKVQGIGPGILSKNRDNLKLASKQAKLDHEK
ncbi:helix-hairpin-helix domain-containing protein [Thiohalophilus sp.]|uniref:ComEA family DNA-binding protein n=1 Tax=Thiohalophilus sp. TaxID=3028392 RepID=UPI002ACE3FBB|nr:helix-hairpin-helix domain-containing protein [Thiohalophilus sp.]MDZ7804697.1 helix-hairpin-helix domain-containing protein [Thiohalophilus sp.]